MSQSPVAYRAKWILPVDGDLIENGTIVCRDGLIDQVTAASHTNVAETVDLGEVALIPGLVNAHTHLEFSELEEPLGDPSLGFPKWIEEVISHRRVRSETDPIQQGINESIRYGVAAIGEIATTPWSHHAYDDRVHGIVFHEQLGNNPLEARAKTLEIENGIQRDFAEPWQAGISPHAPYSTSLNLFQSLVDLARGHDTRVAMHLAETLEEIEFIETAKGPFADLLDRLGIPFNRSGPLKTADYLQQLSTVKSLIIHGNFLNVEELEMIAGSEDQSIVFCPRTHKYFGHPEYPLRTMLDLGINVAVGTDSRASNPDLNLFAELQEIAVSQPDVRPEEILQMGTYSGAIGLGLGQHLGTLTKGKSDKFCVVSQLPGSRNPFESLFAADCQCTRIDQYQDN